uniref:Uncharacterized protein n=1 Tax=Cacopsylla melanoneura TaxID=428564 RepID=A0A8D8S0B4_9HEMI
MTQTDRVMTQVDLALLEVMMQTDLILLEVMTQTDLVLLEVMMEVDNLVMMQADNLVMMQVDRVTTRADQIMLHQGVLKEADLVMLQVPPLMTLIDPFMVEILRILVQMYLVAEGYLISTLVYQPMSKRLVRIELSMILSG